MKQHMIILHNIDLNSINELKNISFLKIYIFEFKSNEIGIRIKNRFRYH